MSFCVITVLITQAGCATTTPKPKASVAQAWGHRDQIQSNTQARYQPHENSQAAHSLQTTTQAKENAIASVNGQSIPRSRLVDLIVRSHGLKILDQLIGLQAAEAQAAKMGLSINSNDVDFEFELALQRLTNPLSAVTPHKLNRNEAELVLDSVLEQRNVSRDELMIILKRNAYLRKMVNTRQQFSPQQIQEEYNKAYGDRVEVRHIQLASPAEVSRVKDQLSDGISFEDLARNYSANQASAQDGGLLECFSRGDDRLPELFRSTAFALQPGDVSDAIRVGEWYHLIRLEKAIPTEDRNIQEVQDELVKRLQDRLTEPAMFKLFENLYQAANIEIYDPALREEFNKRHPFSTQSNMD